LTAGLAVAGLIAEKTLEGKYEVHPGGVEEVGRTRDTTATMSLLACRVRERSYIAEPERVRATGKVNRRRRKRCMPTGGASRATWQRLQRQRGERIERNFAHQFDTAAWTALCP